MGKVSLYIPISLQGIKSFILLTNEFILISSMTTIADINDKWASYAGPGGWNGICPYTFCYVMQSMFSTD